MTAFFCLFCRNASLPDFPLFPTSTKKITPASTNNSSTSQVPSFSASQLPSFDALFDKGLRLRYEVVVAAAIRFSELMPYLIRDCDGSAMLALDSCGRNSELMPCLIRDCDFCRLLFFRTATLLGIDALFDKG